MMSESIAWNAGAECVGGIDSQQVYGYTLYKEGKYAKLTYPLHGYSSDVTGRSFHHGRFIQRLREKAASLPKWEHWHAYILT